jgi:tetratricopeptide (TPR) repeat protein
MAEHVHLSPEVQEIVHQVEELLQGGLNPAVYYTAARTIFDRYFNGTPSDLPGLEQAILWTKQAWDLLPSDNPDLAVLLDTLASMIRERYQLTGKPCDLLEAIDVQRQCVELARSDNSKAGYYGDFCGNQAFLLLEWYQRNGEEESLDKSLTLYQTAVDEGSKDEETQSTHLNGLALALRENYRKFSRLPDLEAALKSINKAKLLYPRRPGYWLTSAQILHDIYEHTNKDEFLEKAITEAEEAYKFTHDQNSSVEELAKVSNYLASVLSARYARKGKVEDLEKGVRLARKVLGDTPKSHPNYVRRSQILCHALQQLFERTGSLQHINESVTIAEDAMATQSFQDSLADQPMHYSNLAKCLHSLYEANGDEECIRKAIEYGTKAISLPGRTADGPIMLINLSLMYETRFTKRGAKADLDEAIRIISEAIKDARPREIAWAMGNMAQMLQLKFLRERDPAVLATAAAVQSEALQRIPDDHPLQFALIHSSGDLAMLQHIAQPSIDLLRQVIAKGTACLEGSDVSDYDKGTMLSGLAELNGLLYGSTHDPSVLDLAISRSEEAVQLSHEQPSGSRRYLHLGTMLLVRCHGGEDKDTLRAAIEAFRNGLNHRFSPLTVRYQCGHQAGYWLAAQQHWKEAAEVLQVVIELLPRISPREVEWDDQQSRLRGLSNMTSLAASVCLEAGGTATDALTLLEAGRGLMARIAANLRFDLEGLDLVDHGMATRYLDLRNRLKILESPLKVISNSYPKSWVYSPGADPVSRRLNIVKELDELETKIRKDVPGFENFLLPKPAKSFPTLVKLLSHAIVAFNVTQFRSDAFLVTATGISHLELPCLHWSDVRAMADMVVGPARITDGTMDTFHGRNMRLRDVLRSLWFYAVCPVLQKLDFLHSGSQDPLPHITWITSGIAGLLPFHAAGSSWGNGRENTASHVVSSYAPTFQAMEAGKDRSSRIRHETVENYVLVTMPTTTGWSPLRVASEVGRIQELLSATRIEKAQHLDTPSKQSVLDHLRQAAVVYFGCHADTDDADPSNGGLYLADGPDGKPMKLTVRDLADISIPQARLAYLSACSTAENRSQDLRDEVLHLAAMLQIVGFPHVVGTMWSADDAAANQVARVFFERILSQGQTEERGHEVDYALALHEATRLVREGRAGGLRRKKNASDNVTVWAPFIHMGW